MARLEERAVLTAEFAGAPDAFVAAWKARASDDPQAVADAKQALEERDGVSYSWSSQTKEFAPALRFTKRRIAIVHVPERRENIARPRERRASSRQRARAPTGDDPSPESDPPLEVIPLSRWQRELRRALGSA